MSLACAVDPAQRAILDAGHRAFVNHEVYYFGSEAALRAFVAEPWRYAGRVTDPVSLSRFQPAASSERRSFGGRLLYFESPETARRFDAEPVTFGTPRPTMRTR